MSTSIGLSIIDEQTTDAQEVIREADTAMYHAKALGKNRVALFDDEMFRSASDRLSLESDLRKALDHKQFRLYLQPIVDLRSCRSGRL